MKSVLRISIAILALTLLPCLAHDPDAAVHLKVGIYQNEPLIFRDADGNVKGIYADIIGHIADDEGWEIEYVEGPWRKMISMLEAGEIDLMTAIAYSEKRAGRYAFTVEPVFSNWGQVYTRPGSFIESILDLEGRKVALLRGDIYNEKFREIVHMFDIHPEYVEVDEYDEIMRMVQDGEADAGMMSRLHGNLHEKDYRVKKSPIICCPVELRIALPKGSAMTSYIIPVLDRRLREMKEKPSSLYYSSMDRWLGGHARKVIPPWVRWAFAGGIAAIAFLVTGAILLRLQVRARTRALEEEMKAREESVRKFRSIFSSAPVSIWLEDLSGIWKRLDELKASGITDIRRYIDENPGILEELAKMLIVLDVNDTALRMYGAKSRKDLLGSLNKVFVPESYSTFKEEIIAIFNGADYFESEVVNGTLDGRKIDVIVSVRIPTDPAEYRNMIVCVTDISERKAIVSELMESENKFRSLVEESLVGVYLIQDGIFKYVNPKLAEIFGYSTDEMIGKKGPLDVVLPEDRHIVARNLQKRLDGEVKSLHYEFRGITRDGETIYIEVFGTRMIYKNKAAVIGTLLDITARRNAENALQKSEQRMRTIIDSEPECVKILNPDCTLREMNPAGLAMIEAESLEQVVGQDVCSIVAPEHREEFRALAKRVLQGESECLEFQITGLKGTKKWLESFAVPLREGGDEITGILSITRDVTKQKELDMELSKLSRAVEQSPVSVVITDTQGNIEYVNPYFCQLTGYSCAEVIGRNPRILKSGRQTTEFYRQMWETISSGNVWKGEFHNKKKNGELYWEDATISPVTDSAGNITHYIAIKEDITERKKLQAQLLHAQKMEAIGKLAAGIAHDFNNILSAIVNYAYIVNRKAEGNIEIHNGIENIVTLADRAAHITRGLLAFSRKQFFELKPLNLNEVVLNMENILSKFIGEDIRLSVNICEQKVFIIADRAQIEQAIMNLATNARDAMPVGGTLTLQTEIVDINDDFIRAHGFGRPGRYALLSVSDTGVGMSEEVRQKIFEPFFTTKEVGKGTGLGLATTYGIIKQHDGYINVYSEPGKGTTFRIYLPVKIAPQEQEKVPESKDLYGNRETILLAEDEVPVRDSVGRILEEFGYEVITAANGREAIERFAANKGKIDLVLIDLVMPGVSGKEAVDEMKRMVPGIKVIFMSGYTSDILQRKKIATKEVSFISKPVLPDLLLQRIKETLGKDKA
jgi:PAS domain S-box-containing protein